MKKTLIVLFAILVFSEAEAFSAAPGPNPENAPCTEINFKEISVPLDFVIVYDRGCRQCTGPALRTHVEVRADGTVKYFKGYVKASLPLQELPFEQRQISQEKVKKIYARVIGCGFFELREYYKNPNPRMMGDTWWISVAASGKSYTVMLYNTSVKKFDSILKTLYKEAGIQTDH